jgi:hypothetical protein
MQRIALQDLVPMTAAKLQRGRPKGSGINDQLRLDEIARLMSADPRMKPTTAIKTLGITDPSTIRRLRDKFHVAQPDLKSNIQSNHASAAAQSSPRAAALKFAEPVKVEAVKRAEPRRTFTATANVNVGLDPGLLAKPAKADTVPVAALLFGFGLNAATAIFEQQMMIAQSVMKLPQVRDLIRSQIAFTEFMLNAASPSPGSRYAH